MRAASPRGLADALLLLSSPLRPPRRGSELRTAHLADLRTPTLFVHGSRNPFGSLEDIEAARRFIPARTALVAYPGSWHDCFRVPSRSVADIAAGNLAKYRQFA